MPWTTNRTVFSRHTVQERHYCLVQDPTNITPSILYSARSRQFAAAAEAGLKSSQFSPDLWLRKESDNSMTDCLEDLWLVKNWKSWGEKAGASLHLDRAQWFLLWRPDGWRNKASLHTTGWSFKALDTASSPRPYLKTARSPRFNQQRNGCRSNQRHDAVFFIKEQKYKNTSAHQKIPSSGQ